LTHDIDSIGFPRLLLERISRDFGQFRIQEVLGRLALLSFEIPAIWDHDHLKYVPAWVHSTLKKFDPLWNFERIVEVEKELGVRSTLFFMADKSKPNANYDINHPVIKKLINDLLQDGFEIGLHASYQSFDNLGLFIKEKDRLEKVTKEPVIGVRQHYLHKASPLTHNLQRKAGFVYDSSVGCLSRFMLKKGWCFPYKTSSGLIEIPILLHDATLVRRKYMGLDSVEARRRTLEAAERVIDMNGMMTVLCHPSSFDLDEHEWWLKLYVELIQFFLERGGRATNCAGILKLVDNRLGT
jgi:peptidoglycan/xylan/chitin deacetylase (PgdA/CDA1 family)